MRLQSQARRRKDPAFWNAINRVLLVLVIIGTGVGIVLWFAPELQARNQLADQLDAKKSELASLNLLRKQREREVFLLENDREYIETIARDKLDMMKEGETIFRLDPSKSATPGQKIN